MDQRLEGPGKGQTSYIGSLATHNTSMSQPAWVKGRLAAEPFFSRFFYGLIIKRSSTYMTFVMVTATTVGALCPFFAHHLLRTFFYLLHARSAPLSRGGARVHSLSAYRMRNAHPHLLILPTGIGYDYFMNAIWDSVNKGKLWKDIKDNYAEED